MDFLNPLLLWGATGISIPILIHLLNRFRFKQVDWAAMELLKRALVVRSRRVRIEDLILLALRCLAVVLLALAFARLTLTGSRARLLGSAADVGVVVAIDGSFSMEHRPGVRSRFEDAIERAREVFSTLNPGSPVSLVLLGDRPRLLLHNVGFDRGRIDKALDGLDALPEALDLEAGLDGIEPLIDELAAPVRECAIVTDAQATTWAELSDRARATLERIGAKARVFVVPIASASDENAAVTGLELASGDPAVGAPVRLLASVTNFASRPKTELTVRLRVGETVVDERVVDSLGPGETEEVALYARFSSTGGTRLAAVTGDDALALDNERYAVVEVRPRIRVLCVDGTGSGGYDSPLAYLLTALDAAPLSRAAGEEEGVFVHAIPWLELSTQRLSEYDILVLANVPDLHPALVPPIYNFVRSGGGLLVFLGENAAGGLLDQRLRHGEVAILPGKPGDVRGGESGDGTGWHVVAAAPNHPIARAIGSLKSELVHRARIRRYVPVELGDAGRAVLGLSGGEASVLSERAIGRGRVLLWTSSVDDSWSDAVFHPVFPIVVKQAITYLTRCDNELPRVVSEPLVMALTGDVPPSGSALVVDPEGAERPASFALVDGLPTVTLPSADSPGFYELQPVNGEPGPSAVVAVNVRRGESNVATLGDAALVQALRAVPVQVVQRGDDAADGIREGRVGKELWWELALGALILLVLEAFLAHRFSNAGGRAA